MTQVQKLSLPVLLSGGDALIKSQTGTGKTIAYTVCMLTSLAGENPPIDRSSGIRALIIVPTRELALQTFKVLELFKQTFVRIVSGVMLGGESRKQEKRLLRKGVNIVVATPGRLLDHMQRTENLSWSKLRWLLLDEADRMLEMGYERDISKVISSISKSSSNSTLQTVLLSATLSQGVEKLAGLSLNKPHFIDVAKFSVKKVTSINELSSIASSKTQRSEEVCEFSLPPTLKQYHTFIPLKMRLVTLLAFVFAKLKLSKMTLATLSRTKIRKILVFVTSCDSATFYSTLFAQLIRESLLPVDSDKEDDSEEFDWPPRIVYHLHGNMDQKERVLTLDSFRASHTALLFSTDVASRGLDLPSVDWIVLYESVGTRVRDYVHRVGRTARIGEVGSSLLFLLPHEAKYVQELRHCNVSSEEADITDCFSYLPTLPGTKEFESNFPSNLAAFVHKQAECLIQQDNHLHDLAGKAYRSYLRAYSTCPKHLRRVFNFHDVHLGHAAKSFALSETPAHIGHASPLITHGVSRKSKRLKYEESNEEEDTITQTTGESLKKHKPLAATHRPIRANQSSKVDPSRKRKQLQPWSASVSEFGDGLS